MQILENRMQILHPVFLVHRKDLVEFKSLKNERMGAEVGLPTLFWNDVGRLKLPVFPGCVMAKFHKNRMKK